MRILILGAGAVGVTLGVSLEQGKHEVAYLVRKGRRATLRKLVLVDARTGEARRRDAPMVLEVGSRPPPFEYALVCVRGDQLDEAMATLAEHARPDAAVGVASARPSELSRARAAHPGGPVFLIAPTFSAWSEPDDVAPTELTVRWFPAPSLPKPFSPLLPTLLSGEGEPKADEAAAAVAAALTAVRVPARAVPALSRTIEPAYASGAALLGAWELAGWDVEALARDGALRSLAGEAAREAAQVVRLDGESAIARLLSMAPAAATSLALSALPRLMNESMRAMWRRHGPKIAAQTRLTLDEVIAGAERGRIGAPSLRSLRARLG